MKVVKTDLYCPSCGAKDVHVDKDDTGDYYAGTTHYCTACDAELPDLGGIKNVVGEHVDDFGLLRYVEIRYAAWLDAGGRTRTAHLREVHAKAVAAREARNRR